MQFDDLYNVFKKRGILEDVSSIEDGNIEHSIIEDDTVEITLSLELAKTLHDLLMAVVEVEDCESCGCEDAEAGCECGNCPDCTPKEDNEYDMGEVFDTIADDIKAGMTKTELEAEHGTAAVRKFMEYTIFDRRGRPTAKTNPRPHVNRKVVNNIKNTPGPDPIEAEDAERVDKDRMKCNKPRRTSGGSKKFVVKACKDGKEKVVRFGYPNMKIKKSIHKRSK